MKTSERILGISVMLIILAVLPSCDVIQAPSSQPGMGSISISVQPFMTEDMITHRFFPRRIEDSRSWMENRAMIGASSIGVIIVDSSKNEIANQTYSNVSGSHVIEVPAGTYTINVKIYNSAMSATVPTVAGSAEVTVSEGGLSYACVMCLPVAATSLTDGAWTPESNFTVVQYDSATGATSGTELWYTCIPSTDALQISTDSGSWCNPWVTLFDNLGVRVDITQALSSGEDTVTFGVTSGQLYYIALQNHGSAAGTISLMYQSITPILVTGVTVSPKVRIAPIGQAVHLKATISPMDATNQAVTWSSSDETVAKAFTTMSRGEVYSLKEGTTTITVTTDDSGFQDTCAVTVVPMPAVPYGSWSTTSLAGGADAASAVEIPSLDKWCSNTVTWPAVMWFKVTVSTSNTYNIYWDTSYEGSGTYTGDDLVYVYRQDGTTEYGCEDAGYDAPMIIQPVETIILIEVVPWYKDGSFALGVHQQ